MHVRHAPSIILLRLWGATRPPPIALDCGPQNEYQIRPLFLRGGLGCRLLVISAFASGREPQWFLCFYNKFLTKLELRVKSSLGSKWSPGSASKSYSGSDTVSKTRSISNPKSDSKSFMAWGEIRRPGARRKRQRGAGIFALLGKFLVPTLGPHCDPHFGGRRNQNS